MNYLFEIWTATVCRPDVICATGIEIAGLVMTAVSAAMSVVGGIQSSQAQKQNKLNAQGDAEQAMVTGQAEADRTRRINQARQAELIAQTGASGTMMTGSPMEVYLENAKQASLEEQDPIYGANLRSKSLKQQASIYGRQATNALFEGFGGAAGKASTMLSPTPGTEAIPKDTRVRAPEDYRWSWNQ